MNPFHSFIIKSASFCALTAFLFSTSCPAQSQNSYWQQEVHYDIKVQLDVAEHRLQAQERMTYVNHSPDTLHFIYIHLWPNAYKTLNTAFALQTSAKNNPDFMWSKPEQRGFIQLNSVQSANETLNWRYCSATGFTAFPDADSIDIAKIYLPKPLFPADSVQISFDFLIKIPNLFSRMGVIDESYAITQWYPKAALYDRNGWHAMHYLDDGEFFSDFGNYKVQITLPSNFIVAATGELKTESELERLNQLALNADFLKSDTTNLLNPIPTASDWKTIQYRAERVHDFAWFADKYFRLIRDTVQLQTHAVQTEVYFRTNMFDVASQALYSADSALRFYSYELGEYAYDYCRVVQMPISAGGGMEYPQIFNMNVYADPAVNASVVLHEVGHNWFQGMLATNERAHPWMDEGLNSFYERRYMQKHFPYDNGADVFGNTAAVLLGLKKKDWSEVNRYYWLFAERIRVLQPVGSHAEVFDAYNDFSSLYTKSVFAIQYLEQLLGKEVFDAGMRSYFSQWKFKHPAPLDFKASMENESGKKLDDFFRWEIDSLQIPDTRLYPPYVGRKKWKVHFLAGMEDNRYHQLNLAPAIAWNNYDKFQMGLLLSNTFLPARKWQWQIAPMWAGGSNKLTGLAALDRYFYPANSVHQLRASLALKRFSYWANPDVLSYNKIQASIQLLWRGKSIRDQPVLTLDLRNANIWQEYQDQELRKTRYYYVNEAALHFSNNRLFIPFHSDFSLRQGKDFVHARSEARFHFNYPRIPKKSFSLRLFAAKSIWNGKDPSDVSPPLPRFVLSANSSPVYRFQKDFLFDELYLDRSGRDRVFSREVKALDAAFYSNVQIGMNTNYMLSLNMNADVPKIPFELFANLAAFDQASFTLAAEAGLSLSVWRDFFRINFPFLITNNIRSNQELNGNERWYEKITFSIDWNRLNIYRNSRNFRQWM